MFSIIKDKFKSIDKKIKKMMKDGSYACLCILLLSSMVLLIYDFLYGSPDLYYIGLAIFQLGLVFLSFFIICGFAFNEIQKQLG